jgi:hypothetical protein
VYFWVALRTTGSWVDMMSPEITPNFEGISDG